MRNADLIQRKRDGEELSPEEIVSLVEGYTAGDVPDYQMSAFLMAVYFSGMVDREITALTDCMIRCGRAIDLSDMPALRWTSTPLAAWAISTSLDRRSAGRRGWCSGSHDLGRALGHTGGTLDKLDSIPGFNTDSARRIQGDPGKDRFGVHGPIPGSWHRPTASCTPCARRRPPWIRFLLSLPPSWRRNLRGDRRPGARRQGGQRRVHEEPG